MFRRRKPEPPIVSVESPGSAPQQENDVLSSQLFATSLPQAPAETERGARPVAPKESAMMPPMASAPAAQRSSMPASQPLPSLRSGSTAKKDVERRTMIVARGVILDGALRECERLVVEGVVETTLISTIELVISPGGLYKGESDVEDADIAGTIDGVITVRGSLTVRSTGKLIGTVRCRRLQVEDGGQISGQLEMITGPAEPGTRVAGAAF